MANATGGVHQCKTSSCPGLAWKLVRSRLQLVALWSATAYSGPLQGNPRLQNAILARPVLNAEATCQCPGRPHCPCLQSHPAPSAAQLDPAPAKTTLCSCAAEVNLSWALEIASNFIKMCVCEAAAGSYAAWAGQTYLWAREASLQLLNSRRALCPHWAGLHAIAEP